MQDSLYPREDIEAKLDGPLLVLLLDVDVHLASQAFDDLPVEAHSRMVKAISATN